MGAPAHGLGVRGALHESWPFTGTGGRWSRGARACGVGARCASWNPAFHVVGRRTLVCRPSKNLLESCGAGSEQARTLASEAQHDPPDEVVGGDRPVRPRIDGLATVVTHDEHRADGHRDRPEVDGVDPAMVEFGLGCGTPSTCSTRPRAPPSALEGHDRLTANSPCPRDRGTPRGPRSRRCRHARELVDDDVIPPEGWAHAPGGDPHRFYDGDEHHDGEDHTRRAQRRCLGEDHPPTALRSRRRRTASSGPTQMRGGHRALIVRAPAPAGAGWAPWRWGRDRPHRR